MSKKQRKLLVRIILAAFLFAAALFVPVKEIGKLFLFLIPYAIVGYDVIKGCIRNVRHGRVFDEKFLMTVATVGAFFLREYPEAVAVMLLYQAGEFFQSLAVGKSRRSIARLMDIRPDSATVIRDGIEVEVFPDEVSVGETILVRPGERLPLDGVILKGETLLDTAALTGESLPRKKMAGDEVLSGSINLRAPVLVRVTKLFEESTVSKILALVESAADKKAVTENFITRFARYYTPAVVIGALVLALLPPLFDGAWQEWLRRALSFLVVSCPCALVISVPLSFFGGIGGASRAGILMKGADNLETLARVKTVVFDKTGTLTEGKFQVTKVCPVGMEMQDLLLLAAKVESYSNHPIALSIVEAAGSFDADGVACEELAGRGMSAVIDGKQILLGNERLMKENGIALPKTEDCGTLVYVALDGDYVGHLLIEDKIKKNTGDAILGLSRLGISRTVMLTGDLQKTGERVGQTLGIRDIRTELLPADKVTAVEELLSASAPLAFVGDGINDAPVLARADVGVAMGVLGSDAAIEAADVVLMDDDPEKLVLAVKIARKTMRIVKENIWFSLAVKGTVLLLSALGMAAMWMAIFADVGVMLLAICNAMRTLRPPRSLKP